MITIAPFVVVNYLRMDDVKFVRGADMKLSKEEDILEQRDCSNGWECGDECYYWDIYNKQCNYHAEERAELQKIADEIGEKDRRQAREEVKWIRQYSDPVRLIKASSANFWDWWAGSSPPDSLKQKEPINAMSGAIELGGGSKSGKKRKKPPRTNPYDYLINQS